MQTNKTVRMICFILMAIGIIGVGTEVMKKLIKTKHPAKSAYTELLAEEATYNELFTAAFKGCISLLRTEKVKELIKSQPMMSLNIIANCQEAAVRMAMQSLVQGKLDTNHIFLKSCLGTYVTNIGRPENPLQEMDIMIFCEDSLKMLSNKESR